eukprot:GDKJ01029450.1.p1 GENE.GDKJ01029450.1~~GDKJ01029450.1.p1  ORF type:complete len:175 (-),score=16.49 GDKJ01029450.1:49-573(-)
MVEEYDVVKDELLLRKSRTPSTVGGEGRWTVEVGNEATAFNPDRDLLKESNDQPVLTRQDDKEFCIWRIRNLPYPKDVFSVTLESSSTSKVGEIVVRTSNKKYYKRIQLPDFERNGLTQLEAANLTFDHSNNTLIIKYKKPLAVLALENGAKKDRAAIPSTRPKTGGEEGCQQQ